MKWLFSYYSGETCIDYEVFRGSNLPVVPTRIIVSHYLPILSHRLAQKFPLS